MATAESNDDAAYIGQFHLPETFERIVDVRSLGSMQDSRDEGRVQLLVTLIQSGDISLQRAAALMNMTPEEFQEKSKMIS